MRTGLRTVLESVSIFVKLLRPRRKSRRRRRDGNFESECQRRREEEEEEEEEDNRFDKTQQIEDFFHVLQTKKNIYESVDNS